MNDHSNLPAMTPEKAGEIMEALLIKGDLAQLNPTERAKYYTRVCASMGINPLTQPLAYITLNGKLTLYALKNCTDQLRKIYSVSVLDMQEKREGDLIVVTVKVQDATGRTDISKGALSLGSLKGEALANAIMKAETKAKRRATLSICGLGFLDETEVETIPGARPEPRVLKKDHRQEYHAMLAELDHTLDLEEWFNTNGARVAALPPEWRANIDAVIASKHADPTVSSGEILADGWSEKQGEGLRTATLSHAPEPPLEVWDSDEIPALDSAWEALGPVKQAGVLSNDAGFARFVSEISDDKTWSTVADFIRDHCGVKSRKALATNDEAAAKWRRLVSEFRAWQKLPQIIDTPHDSDAARSDPPADMPPQVPAGGEAPPSAKLYTELWDSTIKGATPTKRAAILTDWNGQKALRDQIEWTPQHPFLPLKQRVVKALEFLKGEQHGNQ